MALPIARWSYEGIRGKANAFLAEHNPEASIPVPIERIVESRLGVNLIPVPGLLKAHDIDAFISCDFKSLMVDQGVLESRSPNRYRFSLAHEIAHAVLHGDVYAQLPFSTIEEWKERVTTIDDKDLEWLEWQANAFAGLILAPHTPLAEKLREGARIASARGVSVEEASEPAKGFICNWVGRFFEVSSQVIEKRVDKDGLWPPALP